jgi:hypothetical protein
MRGECDAGGNRTSFPYAETSIVNGTCANTRAQVSHARRWEAFNVHRRRNVAGVDAPGSLFQLADRKCTHIDLCQQGCALHIRGRLAIGGMGSIF